MTTESPATREQVDYLERQLELQKSTNTSLVNQVMRLGQCVECGELDEQDGVRINGEFRCIRCTETR